MNVLEADADHYAALGLPSEEEGLKLSEKEIHRAYKRKAFELHPDKNPGDEEANRKFQKLQSSYEVLKDDKRRKLYDDRLRVKILKRRQQQQQERRRRASSRAGHVAAAAAAEVEVDDESIERLAREYVQRKKQDMDGGKKKKTTVDEEGQRRLQEIRELIIKQKIAAAAR
ncbi:unnamed protein product [Linum trigynum]